jgi:small subunit ribosomal protein S10
MATTKAKKVTNNEPKMRIKAEAFDSTVLDLAVKKIMEIAQKYNATVIGPVPLPTKIKKYTVLRSSFVYKNAREQFEMRIHKRILDIVNPDSKLSEALSHITLPSGVDLEVKMV